MRRLISLGLISLFLLTQLGSVIWYYTRPLIHFICSNRQENLLSGFTDRENLTTLQISTAQFQTEFRGEDEIRLGGILYDVVSVQKEKDSLLLTLESDILETSLLAKYDRITENFIKTHPAQKQADQHLWKWVFQLFNPPPAEKRNILFAVEPMLNPDPYIPSLSVAFLDVPAQPPRHSGC